MYIFEGGVGIKSEFYTLKGYKIMENQNITEAMEDYIEMIYRQNKEYVTIKEISTFLNVTSSSVSKMANRLKNNELINFERYGKIKLTDKGIQLGKFLLWRHNILKKFFKKLNRNNYSLKQVEKIEHFVDYITLININKTLKKTNFF